MQTEEQRKDFEWSWTDEPHLTRRLEILDVHPEVRKHMGYDYLPILTATAVNAAQLLFMHFVLDWSWWALLPFMFVVSATLTHFSATLMHEGAHGLVFGANRPYANAVYGYYATALMMLPMFSGFRKYHLDHHKYQGDEMIDADAPTEWEARHFQGFFGKLIWMCLLPFFYIFRPLFRLPKPLDASDLSNIAFTVAMDYLIYSYFGWRGCAYLLGSGYIGMTGIHPCGAHTLAEHFMWAKGYETYSYYGILNWVSTNLGFHNEHHDFPNVPGRRLPKVAPTAPEYYNHLPTVNWFMVVYEYLFNPKMGPYMRVRRPYNFKMSLRKRGLLKGDPLENEATPEANGNVAEKSH